jgi:hypothetical protein
LSIAIASKVVSRLPEEMVSVHFFWQKNELTLGADKPFSPLTVVREPASAR